MPLTSDVQVVNSVGTSTVDDAAENINSSKVLGMTPDGYQEVKPQLKPQYEEVFRYPANVDPVVAESLGKSKNHSSMIKTDTQDLNVFTEYADYLGDVIKGKSTARDANSLYAKMSRGEELSDEEQSTLDDAVYTMDETQRKHKDRTFVESIPGEAAGLVFDVGMAMRDQFPILAGATTVGALGYGALGSFAGPAGALIGGGLGGVKGFGLGVAGAFISDTYNQGTGAVYGELVKEDMPETDRRQISQGAGILMGAAALVPGFVLSKATPWLMKWLRPGAYAKSLAGPGGKQMMSLSKALGISALAEGGEESGQEAIQILAENLGKTFEGGTEADFFEAINKTVGDLEALKTTGERVGKAGLLGAIGGTMFTGVARAAGVGADTVLKDDTAAEPRDVTDTVTQKLLEAPTPAVTDIVGDNPNLPTIVKGTNAIHVKVALEQMSQVTKDTNTNQNVPDEMDIIRQKKFSNVGLGEFFIDKQALKDWSDTEEKGAAARNAVDKSGVAAAEMNAPIRLDAFKMFQLIDQHPDIVDIVKTTPEGVTFQEYVNQMSEADTVRAEFLGEIPQRAKVEGVKEPLSDKEIFETQNISEEDRTVLKGLRKESKAVQSEINVKIEESQKLVDTIPEDTEMTSDQKVIVREHKKLIKERDQLAGHARSKVRNILVKYHPGAQPRLRDQDVFNEADFLEQPTLTPEMLSHIPSSKVAKMVEGERKARQAVSEAILDAEAKRMNKVVDVHTETQLLMEREVLAETIDTNEDIALIESYIAPDIVDGKSVKGGTPVNQINPDSLTARQRVKYIDDQVLAERKVFSKNGADLKQVARVFNKKPEDLLNTLATTPNREQAIQNAIDDSRSDIEAEARRDAELDDSALSKAYNNTIKNHLSQLKHMISKDWTGFKQGVRLVAFDLPKFQNIINDAQSAVGGTKVKHLNVNQWKVGERKSNRIAMNVILKQDQEVALREKQNAAMNAAMAQQTHISIGKVNRNQAFLSRLGSRRVGAVLKEAGPTYQKAIDDLLTMFSFDKSTNKTIRTENYRKYAKNQAEIGNGDHSVPDETLQWLDTAESGKDLTVDQMNYVTGLAKSVLRQAKMKNQLMGKYKKEKLQMSEDLVAATIVKELSNHPDSKDSNLVVKPGDSKTTAETISDFIDSADNATTNNQFITLRLDQEIKNGLMSKLVWQAITGTGSHEGPYGLSAKIKWQKLLKDKLDQGVKEYGEKDFLNLGRVNLDIVEFKGNHLLNNGSLTKSELLTMAMHVGNDENIQRLTNYDIDENTLKIVIEKYLDKRDVDYVQSVVWDTYRKVGPVLQDLEWETRGVELELTTPKPFTMFGTDYIGGHMPIKYKKDSTVEMITEMMRKRQESSDDGSKTTFIPVNIKEGIVKSNHTKERKGANWLVDLSFSSLGIGFDEVVHDMVMRVPVRDVTKLLTREDVAVAITKIIGKRQYQTYVHSVAEQTNAASAENGALYNANSIAIKNFVKSVEGSVATSYIALNPGSVLMATLGVPQAIRVMGPNGGRHMGKAALSILNPINYSKMKEMFKYAAELDPSLQTAVMGFTEIEAKVLSEGRNAPKVRMVKEGVTGKVYDLGRSAQERAKHLAFHTILNSVDVMMKFTTAIASSNQFIAGDAPGFPLEKVRAMTPAQLMENIKGYSAQISAGSLMTTSSFEKAPIQKNLTGSIATNFWNEPRSVLGSSKSIFRQLSQSSEKMTKKAKSGDYLGANLELENSFGLATRTLLMVIVSTYVIQLSRRLFETEKKEERREDEDEIASERNMLLTGADVATGVVNEMVFNHVPVLRDILFAIDVKGSRIGRGVSMPLFSGLTSIAKGVSATPALLGELQLLEAEKELTTHDFKQMVTTVSIFAGGIPVNGPFKMYEYYHDGDGAEDLKTIGSIAALPVLALVSGYDYFVEKYDKSPDREGMSEDEVYPQMTEEELEREYEKEQGNREPQSVMQQAVDQVKDIRAEMRPISQNDPMTNEGYESLSIALSGDDWTKVGSNGETGSYQFTEEKWNEIMNDPKARKLDLTENGRVSKDQGQQQRAMKFESTKNAAILAKQEIAVNLETLLYAHMFGLKDAAKVWTGSPKTKLSKEMKADPRLKEAKVKNAGDMRKYIEGLL
jgi:hypothetical protein